MAAAFGPGSYGLFLLSMFIYAALVLAAMVRSFHHGSVIGAVITTLMASAVPYYTLAWVLEHRPPSQVFNLVHGSWSFQIGDTIVASYVAAMLALGWRRLRSLQLQDRWYMGLPAILGAALIGFAFGVLFHLHERSAYAASALSSPSKLYHDLAAFTILIGGLLYGLVAVLANKVSRRFGWFALAGVGIMLVLMACDNPPIRSLDPTQLQGPYDWGFGPRV